MWGWAKRGLIAAAVLFAALSVVIASFFVLQRHRMTQFDRTYERPLQSDPGDPVLEDSHRLLALLPPQSGANSLRLAVMPSFGKRWFAVSLTEMGGKGFGQAVIVQPDGKLISRRSFYLPANDLKRFFSTWDAISDGYSGETRSFADGNPLAFERRRGRRFTSGVGNGPCHYDVLSDWAAQQLSPQVPELSDLRQPALAQMLATDTCNRSIFGLN